MKARIAKKIFEAYAAYKAQQIIRDHAPIYNVR